MVRVITHFSLHLSSDKHSEFTINRCVELAEESEGRLKLRRSYRSYNDDKLYFFSAEIPTDDPFHDRLMAVWRSLQDDPFCSWHQSSIFTKEEIDAAELLVCNPTNYATHTRPDTSGTVYERITVCDRCNLKRREQRSPLRLRNANVQGRKISWTYGEDTYVLSPELADFFREWGVTGCELAPVRNSGKGKDSPLVQLIPTWRLPDDLAPSTPFTVIDFALCPKCGRMGKNPRALHYERQELGEIKDVGFAPVFYSMNYYCHGKLIISRRLYQLFKEHKVKGYEVQPVWVV